MSCVFLLLYEKTSFRKNVGLKKLLASNFISICKLGLKIFFRITKFYEKIRLKLLFTKQIKGLNLTVNTSHYLNVLIFIKTFECLVYKTRC